MIDVQVRVLGTDPDARGPLRRVKDDGEGTGGVFGSVLGDLSKAGRGLSVQNCDFEALRDGFEQVFNDQLRRIFERNFVSAFGASERVITNLCAEQHRGRCHFRIQEGQRDGRVQRN